MFHVKQSLNLSFSPFPTLFTERLILREITVADTEDFFAIRSNLIVMKALDKVPYKEINEMIEFINFLELQLKQQQGIRWAVCLKTNNRMIGCVGFHRINHKTQLAEIGYELLPSYHRQGIITEAITTLLTYAFNHIGLEVIEAGVNPDNYISISLLTKLGFTKVRHVTGDYLFNGVYLDSDYYTIHRIGKTVS